MWLEDENIISNSRNFLEKKRKKKWYNSEQNDGGVGVRKRREEKDKCEENYEEERGLQDTVDKMMERGIDEEDTKWGKKEKYEKQDHKNKERNFR